MRQYCQVYVKLRLQQRIKKVPKAFALDTNKSILSQFEIERKYPLHLTIICEVILDANPSYTATYHDAQIYVIFYQAIS